MFEIRDLGIRNNIDVIQSFVSLSDLRVVDIGCGNLGFTSQIAEFSQHVLAIDPDPVQAQHNRDIDHSKNIDFVETHAQSIPAADHSLDGAFFAYSLHHIESSTYPDVFAEVYRVLKHGGFIYVIEPIDCPLNQVMRLFHDEEAERAAAQDWLASIAEKFHSIEAVEYHGYTQYESFDDFATKFSSKSFNSLYSEQDVREPEVEAAFHKHGGSDLRFASPRRVVFLNQLKG